MDLSEGQAQRLLERLPTASPHDLTVLRRALAAESWGRCETDGLWFLQFVRTRDEADPSVATKPFPVHLQYIRDLWNLLVSEQRLAVPKSRQMRVSWILCAFAVWWARFHPNQLVLWQTQKWEDALEKVAMPGKGEGGFKGRCQFIEANLPDWLKLPITANEGRIDYPNGSRIQALPGGADKIRGLTASVIIEDEFAFQPEAYGVYTSVAPLVQKAARLIAVSTPNGTGNCFADLVFGYNTAEHAPTMSGAL